MKHFFIFSTLLLATIVATAQTQTYTVNGVSFEMVKVEGGKFMMGAQKNEENGLNYDADALDFEHPVHEVTISSYSIGQTEVTQELWQAVMGKSLSQIISENNSRKACGIGNKYPMYYVSWNDVQKFISTLNSLTGKEFRLPTEAEWEFAARGGNKSRGYKYAGGDNIGTVAWYKGNSDRTQPVAQESSYEFELYDISDNNNKGTAPRYEGNYSQTQKVAQKSPNELGLYDMSGNVWEWCSDWYYKYRSSSQTNPQGASSGSFRVYRGGGWNNIASDCRVHYRGGGNPDDRRNLIGFRLVLDNSSSKSSNNNKNSSGSGESNYSSGNKDYLFDTQTYTVNGVSFEMVKVEGGTFGMGSNDPDASKRITWSYTPFSKQSNADTASFERPVHSVTLSSYSIGQTEVTQELWKAVMGSNLSSNRKGGNYPVESVSWSNVQDFVHRLNSLTGKNFRLPTEAEWEFAARGGNKSKGYKYAGSNSIDYVAWYKSNSDGNTHPVAQKSPNELGLYDMSGNVWEWCSDWYGEYSDSSQTNPQGADYGSQRVFRGGNMAHETNWCSVTFRCGCNSEYKIPYLGFRLVLDNSSSKSSSSNNYKSVADSSGYDFDGYSFDTQMYTVNGVSFEMVKVDGCTFSMGVSDADDDEKPVHKVTLSSYSIGQTEVTQELWQAVMGKSLSQMISENNSWKACGIGNNYPMYYVSWNDVQTFITKLNELTGEVFRLPTEAEWEFAARGGNKSKHYGYAGSNIIGDVAWYTDNSGHQMHPVAQKLPNELGIYDMCGNVNEWCSDWYGSYSREAQTNPAGVPTGSYRVIRGGSVWHGEWACRMSVRLKSNPDSYANTIGFRLAL